MRTAGVAAVRPACAVAWEGALQSDRLRNAQTDIGATIAENTHWTCGICDATVALECDPPVRKKLQTAVCNHKSGHYIN